MTVAAETNRKTYSCNGVLTDFSFDFLIFDEDDLKVTITDSGGTPTVLAITTDYTAAGGSSATRFPLVQSKFISLPLSAVVTV